MTERRGDDRHRVRRCPSPRGATDRPRRGGRWPRALTSSLRRRTQPVTTRTSPAGLRGRASASVRCWTPSRRPRGTPPADHRDRGPDPLLHVAGSREDCSARVTDLWRVPRSQHLRHGRQARPLDHTSGAVAWSSAPLPRQSSSRRTRRFGAYQAVAVAHQLGDLVPVDRPLRQVEEVADVPVAGHVLGQLEALGIRGDQRLVLVRPRRGR